MIRSAMLSLMRWGFLTAACTLLAASAWADSVPSASERGQSSGFVAPPRTPVVRLTSWRAHNVCPMQGTVRSVRSVDSLREWRDTLSADEAGAVGRRVFWSREKVLVYAMATQTKGSTQLEPAGSVLRLSSGVLWWPVKRSTPTDDEVPFKGPSRPCLIALVNRAQWHRIRVVERTH